MNLSRDQIKQLYEALLRAFPRKSDLEIMVDFNLNESLDNIARGTTLNEIVFNLIRWAEAHGKLEALIKAAREANPTNPQLHALADLIGLNISPISDTSNKINVPVNFVVAAMTNSEVEDLMNESIFNNDNVTRKEHLQFKEFNSALLEHGVTTLLSSYGEQRENWKPDAHTPREINSIILDMIHRINKSTRSEGSSLPLLKAQLFSRGFFAEDANIRKEVWRKLGQSGYILIIDAVSLFHPVLRRRLLQSQMGANEQQISMVLLSPLSSNLLRPNRIIEDAIRDQMQRAFDRFSEELDWRCEFGIGDVRAMQRWLVSILIETAKSTQRPKANSSSLQVFRNHVDQTRLGIDQLIFGASRGSE